MLLSALSVLMDGKCIVCSDIISISHPLPLMCKSNEQTKFKGGFMHHLLLSVPRSINCSSLVSAASIPVSQCCPCICSPWSWPLYWPSPGRPGQRRRPSLSSPSCTACSGTRPGPAPGIWSVTLSWASQSGRRKNPSLTLQRCSGKSHPGNNISF